MKRVGLLWKTEHMGLYANSPTDPLYAAVGHNTGNLAYVYALRQSIAHPVKHYAWGTPAERLADECDVLLFPGANQLGRHTDLGSLGERLARAGVPVVAVGVGAQAENFAQDVDISPGTRAWIETVNRLRPGSASNIYTRGPYTTRQLARIGIEDSVSGGCPTHFLNPAPDLGTQIQARWLAHPLPRRISVAAGHEAWTQLTHIEHQLVALMMDDVHPGQYVTQSMLEMLRISRGEFEAVKPATLAAIHRYTVPHYTPEEFQAWCRRYVHSFYDVATWMDNLRRFDLAIGVRYHGVALALQAGVMGLTITFDSRTRELCEQTGVPFVAAEEISGPITRRTLRERYLKFDAPAYDQFRHERARTFAQFLIDNGLTPSDALLNLSGLTPKPPPHKPAARPAPAVQASAPVAKPVSEPEPVAAVSALAPIPAPASASAPQPVSTPVQARTGGRRYENWLKLLPELRARPEATRLARAAELQEFIRSPEFDTLRSFSKAHCGWQPLTPELCTRVLALPSDLWALFGLAVPMVKHHIRLERPLDTEQQAVADQHGLALTQLTQWAQDFLQPAPPWQTQLQHARYASPEAADTVLACERFTGFQDRAIEAQRLQIPDPLTGEWCSAIDSFVAYGRCTYLFRGREPFYLLTTGAGMKATALYLPGRGILLDLGASLPQMLREEILANTLGIQIGRLARHAQAYALALAASPQALEAPRQIVLCLGSAENFAHHYWNYLPVVERQVLAGRTDKVAQVLSFGSEFFGAFTALYPEFRERHVHQPRDGIISPHPFSLTHLMVAGGGYFVPASLRERLLSTLQHLPRTAHALAPEDLPADAGPVVWFGLRTASRAWDEQVQGVASLIQQVQAVFPQAVFLLDGFSYPAGQDFISHKWDSTRQALQALAEQIRQRCGEATPRVFSLVGNSLRESVLLASRVDAYISPVGTTQHKVGWFSPGAGLVYAGPSLATVPSGRRPGSWEAEGICPPHYLLGEPVGEGERRGPHDQRTHLDNLRLDLPTLSQRLLALLRERCPQAARADRCEAMVS